MINTNLFSMFDLPGHHRRRRCGRAATGYVHVGGTCSVTWSTDQSIQRQARTTWGVELIRANFFHRFLVCLTLPLRSILAFFLQCSTRYKVHAWKLGEPVECMPCQNALFQPSVNDTGELVVPNLLSV
jgi:hypothetical protein